MELLDNHKIIEWMQNYGIKVIKLRLILILNINKN